MDPNTEQSPAPVLPAPVPKRRTWIFEIAGLAIVLTMSWGLWVYWQPHKTKLAARVAAVTASPSPSSTPPTQGLVLDPKHDYGNQYADGVLPVGDGKYTTSAAKAGYVYACSSYAQNLSAGAGGAQARGPWFIDNNTEYDINKKIHVEGNVLSTADYHMTISGDTRTITTNDLPMHPTGIFPILSSDPAYAYDRNPNSIQSQAFTFALPLDPSYGDPTCETGEVGIMTTGVVLFNGFDAGGRDAGAWEVQDECNGHPQTDGIYHYHTLSACIKDTSVHDVIGYALDGFPITGPELATNNILTTADLDECHGITSQIILDGKSVTMYHYVMTADFPYSISCFRGKAITPPGQPSGGSQGGEAGGPPPPRP
jgi:hypothetical protein